MLQTPAVRACAVSAVLGGVLWIASTTWSTLATGFDAEAAARHWISHVVTDLPNPFLAIGLYGLFMRQRPRMGWYGILGTVLAIIGLLGTSITGAAILISRGQGKLYTAAHESEYIYILVFLGLLLFYAGSLSARVFPREAILLVLAGVPIGHAVAVAIVALGGGRAFYLLGPSMLGFSFIWLGLFTLGNGPDLDRPSRVRSDPVSKHP